MSKKLTIEDMQRLAESRGGKCLSSEYINNSAKLKWQCKEGHVWETRASNIMGDRWCWECYVQSKYCTIQEMQEIAESRGGKCLSTEYVDSKTKLRWQCKEGHVWEAQPASVKGGAWCFECAIKERGDRRRSSIQELQDLARSKGGLCLSKEYLHSRDKLQWKCADGHTWWSDLTNIKVHWCPACAQGLSERVCRKIFEEMFQEPFPNRRPSWLRGPKGGRMELDGYCEKLGLAFEYQGEQHYKQHEMFHRKASFRERQQLDELKKQLCKEHNVILIEVPYTVEYEQMVGWIVNECFKREVTIPNTDWIDYKMLDVYSPKRLKELKELAAMRGGQCLSETYLGVDTKMKWKCKEGHIWETIPTVIKRGGWCAVCAGRHNWTIDDMRKLAEGRGGKCLSEEYVDNTTKLRWECEHGHQWESTPSNVLSGNWCPHCAGTLMKTIEDMHVLANKRGGYCLSDTYRGVFKELTWKCSNGHVWEARPANIRLGTWCPYCKGRYKTIKDMQIIASERGGQCISEKYLGTHTKHKWKCAYDHEWEATPAHILHGTWCPYCSNRLNKRIPLKCKQCGKDFSIIPYYAKTAKYCSKKCQNDSMIGHNPWNKGKTYSVLSTRKARVIKICQMCGKTFYRLACSLKRKGEGKYCSKKCHNLSNVGKPPWNKGKHLSQRRKE